ncbi:MAG TPA: imidazolonepropionase [Steroidobacteraceae bacterium]|nr:imidazolonepropionase [Steroidobacteraceae bacterium]
MLTLWRNARVATCNEHGQVHAAGAIVTRGGTIEWVGDAREVPSGLRPDRTVELANRWVTPGLVDCHTHLVFAGQRAAEFARRTSGSSYAEIAREGGGILSTVRATRAASEDDLVEQSRPRLASLLAEGVTTVEIKSGYGLDFEGESKMLRAARRLESEHPVTVSTSLLAAHALPPEFSGRADDYIDTVCNDWLPRLLREGGVAAAGPAKGQSPAPRKGQSPGRLVDAVDAYCEDIAFSTEQCGRLFAAARAHGLPVRLHSEQLSNIGGSQVAARYGALSCDHLEYANEADAAALARSGTVAVLLPVAFYALAEEQLPPVAALRANRVPIAVASDCNPGTSPCASLLLAMNMARRLFGLTSEEVLLGATRHAARALGLEAERGSIAPGHAADFAAWSVDSPDELGYWAGFNPCSMVVKDGEIVLERAV